MIRLRGNRLLQSLPLSLLQKRPNPLPPDRDPRSSNMNKRTMPSEKHQERNNTILTSIQRFSSELAGILVLSSMICTCSISAVNAGPPADSFGVWDRGFTFNPEEYPFLKGLTFNKRWADVEKQPGVFDWSELDQAVEVAFQNKYFMYVSLGAGPESPDWIYEHGVPKVFTDDTKHEGKWQHYPYYLAPAYKSYYERVIMELGKHIPSYPKEKQDFIAFVQVKSGCTGDEVAYKGNPNDSRYDLDKQSAEWLAFRLETFALYKKTFREAAGRPIDLLFNCVYANQKGDPVYMEEWNWVTSPYC